jgi:hypothetical protein
MMLVMLIPKLILTRFPRRVQTTGPVGAARGQEFTARVFRLRALTMFDTKLSAAAFVQYNSGANLVTGNFRIRYNPREGVDVYLVYDENLNSGRYREFPTLPLSSGRPILLKCSCTFSL